MAVIVEKLNVIIRVDAIERIMPGGLDAFHDRYFAPSAISDGELFRYGVSEPGQAAAICDSLTDMSFKHQDSGRCVDFSVVDQIRGPTLQSDWLEFGRGLIGTAYVSMCRLRGSKSDQVITPASWSYTGSSSDMLRLIDEKEVTPGMTLLGDQNGYTVYADGPRRFYLRDRRPRQ